MINIMARCWPWDHRDVEADSYDGDGADMLEGNEKIVRRLMGKLEKACVVDSWQENGFADHSELD
jgi:hypothetical protein